MRNIAYLEARRRALETHLRDERDDGLVLLEGPEFDGGIIGVSIDGRAVYSYEKLVVALMKANGWDEQDAIDWVDFNTVGSLVASGGHMPIVMHELDTDDLARGEALDTEVGDMVQYGAER